MTMKMKWVPAVLKLTSSLPPRLRSQPKNGIVTLKNVDYRHLQKYNHSHPRPSPMCISQGRPGYCCCNSWLDHGAMIMYYSQALMKTHLARLWLRFSAQCVLATFSWCHAIASTYVYKVYRYIHVPCTARGTCVYINAFHVATLIDGLSVKIRWVLCWRSVRSVYCEVFARVIFYPQNRWEKHTYLLLTMSLEVLKNALRVPVNLLVMVFLLPVLVVEYILGGLTLLASIGSLLQCEDRGLALKFITAYQSGALLKAKFPNSIAVRS